MVAKPWATVPTPSCTLNEPRTIASPLADAVCPSTSLRARIAAARQRPFAIRELRDFVTDFFPMLRDVDIDHAWSGVLGVPRDWCATVSLDRSTGLSVAGGYVGKGVTATNLAGRTIRDLVLGRGTDLTRLPWVDWRSRSWEPEPLRWIGVRSMYLAYRAADRAEARGGSSTSRIARLADFISGQ